MKLNNDQLYDGANKHFQISLHFHAGWGNKDSFVYNNYFKTSMKHRIMGLLCAEKK